MARYTIQQRIKIIKVYWRNSESVALTLRALRPIYGRHNRPNRSTIERQVKKFETIPSLLRGIVTTLNFREF